MKLRIILFALAFISFNSPLWAQFTIPAMPYAYDALEPAIDSMTMRIHHQRHHQAYVNGLNEALAGQGNISLEELMKNMSKYSDKARNNGGGHYNHSLFWTVLTPAQNTQPSSRLLQAIQASYGSLDSLKKLMNQAALGRFGSGWVWLSVGENKKLMVSSTPNQDNPLMDVVPQAQRGTPVLGIDVWEHAYYLKYQNKRGEYLGNVWSVINWNEVSKRYESLVPKGKFDDWPAIKEFHKVMSETFHSAEDGNLEPIRKLSTVMVERAVALSKSVIPSEFDKKEVKAAIADLVKESKKLDDLVQKKAKDADITAKLTQLHDIFHKIVGLCSEEH
jgi:superoxide dismutase